jgi:hypothetical protein
MSTTNDLSAAVPRFCLSLEEYRRTPEGRVRTSHELLATFFPHDETKCTDRLFRYLPRDVRGPIVAAWGIRGLKSALRDPDDKIQEVVHDALVAGDLDHAAFEEGLLPETLARWMPLADLWAFWRAGKLTKHAIHKALSVAYELHLFDARWFLEVVQARGGALKGTDVLADGLTKDELTQWIRRIHETGDATPNGLVGALGWDKIIAKTPNDVLVGVLDSVATRSGLLVAPRESGPRLPMPAPSRAPQAPVTASGKTGAETVRAIGTAPAGNGGGGAVPGPDGGQVFDVIVDDAGFNSVEGTSAAGHGQAAGTPIEDDQTQIIRQGKRRSEHPSRGPLPGR